MPMVFGRICCESGAEEEVDGMVGFIKAKKLKKAERGVQDGQANEPIWGHVLDSALLI